MKESNEVLKDVLDKTSAKEIAAALNVSISLIYKWSQPDDGAHGGAANPLDRVAQLFDVTRDQQLIQWLCHRADGFFVHNPMTARKRNIEVMPATQEIVQQFADLLGAISQAAADRAISEPEAEKIRHVWDELKRHTEGFVRCCELGDFVDLKVLAPEPQSR